ncbi:MAG: hypothetical protein U9R27_01170 [Campylobacterota bacterium]|nr:hypothetical protein [Campylobacterota bacterium]
MNKQNIIQITLFVSVLVFNPVVADTHRIGTNIQTNLNLNITEEITSLLYKRGLEEKAAKERAEELVEGNAELFTLMLNNLLYRCNSIAKENIVKYLSLAALHKQSVTLNSYDQLIDIYSKIKKSTPDIDVREKLSAIAKSNTLMVG